MAVKDWRILRWVLLTYYLMYHNLLLYFSSSLALCSLSKYKKMYAEKLITITCRCASFTLPQMPGDNRQRGKNKQFLTVNKAVRAWNRVSYHGIGIAALWGFWSWGRCLSQAHSYSEMPSFLELLSGTDHPFFPPSVNSFLWALVRRAGSAACGKSLCGACSSE